MIHGKLLKTYLGPVVSKKTHLPILGTIHFTADGHAEATDFENHISIQVANNVECLLPWDLVKKLGDFTIVQPSKDKVILQSGKKTVEYALEYPVDEYPKHREVDAKGHRVVVSIDELLHVFDFVSVDETRQSLCGVMLSPDGLAATNGHIMCWYQKSLSGQKFEPVILSADMVRQIKRLAKKGCGDLEFLLDDYGALVTKVWASGHPIVKLTGRLIGGPYPNLRQLVPDQGKLWPLDIDTSEWLAIIRELQPLTEDYHNRVQIECGSGEVRFVADNNRTKTVLEYPKGIGVVGRIDFNASKLLQMSPDTKLHLQHEDGQIAPDRPIICTNDCGLHMQCMPLEYEGWNV